ncbi:hypothetical protein CDAR_608631 [Caerostris darwini]|uniref:Uncharacterized protein n=1 Tax=Caerostris darwini TaxID=1538125 RepID=A0AAV4WJP9_9ARAC|nr:hypothetical protein CDAR_608631 [Caerostris darwini]
MATLFHPDFHLYRKRKKVAPCWKYKTFSCSPDPSSKERRCLAWLSFVRNHSLPCDTMLRFTACIVVHPSFLTPHPPLCHSLSPPLCWRTHKKDFLQEIRFSIRPLLMPRAVICRLAAIQ